MIVAVALLAAGCHRAVSVVGPFMPPTTTPAGPNGAVSTVPGPLPGSVPAAGVNNLVSLDGLARSVETTAAVTGLTTVHLTGPSSMTASGEVIDRGGRDLGTGTLRADGTDLVVASPGATLQLASRLRVQPSQVTLTNGVELGFSGSATISSSHLTFQPPPPPPPATTAQTSGTTMPVATTTVPPSVPVVGPVTVRAPGIQISGSALHWVNAPADLSVASGEADLSWAGSGSVITATGPLRAPFLGVRAQQLQAGLHRSPAGVAVRGSGLALQAYVNGVPQLRVPARFDVLSTGATTGVLGRRHAFVWTPRNLDNTYDMAILSIHPANAAAGGVHVGLLPMPPMFGGEPHAPVGGDTAGLKGGDAIDSLIARHGDDKRSVGYDASPGVPLILVIQGNFDPITVSVTTY